MTSRPNVDIKLCPSVEDLFAVWALKGSGFPGLMFQPDVILESRLSLEHSLTAIPVTFKGWSLDSVVFFFILRVLSVRILFQDVSHFRFVMDLCVTSSLGSRRQD